MPGRRGEIRQYAAAWVNVSQDRRPLWGGDIDLIDVDQEAGVHTRVY
jgi:hypothetical protein